MASKERSNVDGAYSCNGDTGSSSPASSHGAPLPNSYGGTITSSSTPASSHEALLPTDYEDLGRELLQAMQTYNLYRQQDPSTIPPKMSSAQQSITYAGELARERVNALAQEVLTATMDPETHLLVKSLQFHFCSCLKVALDLNIAEHVPNCGDICAQKLADAVGAQASLLVRVMRVLTTNSVFIESKLGFYGHTKMSQVLRGEGKMSLLRHRLEEGFRSASRQADALRLNNYREPVQSDLYGFNLAFDTDTNFWNFVTDKDPTRGKNFNAAMKAVNINALQFIPTLYPFDILVKDGGLLVDVGGGLGQVAREIQSHYSDAGLSLVVQDQYAALDAEAVCLNAAQNVRLQEHNFFNPQPILGAAAYFFRHIFHDWPDDACIKILQQTVAAMDVNRSRILICDQVVREINPSAAAELYDIDMMSMYGGKERTLAEWKKLLEEADERLHITNVVEAPSAPTILEVMLR